MSSERMQHMSPSRRFTITARIAAACCDRVVNHGNDRRTRSSRLLISNRENGQPLARRPADASTAKHRNSAEARTVKSWDWPSIYGHRTGELRFSTGPATA